MNVLKTFLAIGCFAIVPLSINAQSCGEKLKTARELQKSGVASKDVTKLNKAVYMYRLVSQCDPDVKNQCNKEINAINKVIKSLKPDLSISTAEVSIPYQGGARQIDVVANGKWKIEGEQDWLKTETFENNSFAVNCLEANNSTREKSATIYVKSGDIFKSLKVVQEARPEYIEVGAQNVSFPSSGADDVIKIESNAKWDVSSVPSWCKIEKTSNGEGIRIIVKPNDKVSDRIADITVYSPKESVTIRISQGAGEEHLTLSQNNLIFNSEGDEHYLKVYTDADNWFVGDYPTWMHVERVGTDSIKIKCGQNIPNGETRSGSVQIKTDRQTAGVMISQSPRYPQDLIFPESKVIGGRNISFGFSASCYLPFVSTSAGGDYVGSVVDYGLGTSAENASYKSAIGYSFGAFADIRLYKNIFLTAGVNFTQIKYKNEFNKNTTYTMPRSSYEYMRGEVQNSYTESYTHTMIEVPILASYRFKTGRVSHVQLNVGPVLNFGLSAKMNLSGNTDCETMKIYNNVTHQPVDNSNYLRHTAVNADYNLYQPCVQWNEMYTTGNDAAVPHHDEFQSAPFKKVNCGLRFGVAYEYAGISFALTYTQMLTNMAQKNYWENDRFTVLNNSDTTMKGYSHRLNTLEFKLAYTLRYLGLKSKNKKNK